MSYFIAHNFSPSIDYNVARRCIFAAHHFRKRRISVPSRRRHHRRRLLKHLPNADQYSPPSDQGLQIILNVDSLSNSKPVSYVNGLVESSQLMLNEFIFAADEAFRDLQTLVSIDGNTKRVVVSCRRSTVQFVGALIVSSLLIVFVFRVLIRFLFGRQSYDSGNSAGLVYRRDRSLGGKEVLVGRATDIDKNRSLRKDQTARLMSILDEFDDDDDDDVIRKTSFLDRRKRRRSVQKLPKWWPESLPGTCQGLPGDNTEEFKSMANRLIRGNKL